MDFFHHGGTEDISLKTSIIYTSHKEIADDLVTSREVISRLLKQMEKKQLVELSRGKIKLTGLLKSITSVKNGLTA